VRRWIIEAYTLMSASHATDKSSVTIYWPSNNSTVKSLHI
jgi:hypothetical protein